MNCQPSVKTNDLTIPAAAATGSDAAEAGKIVPGDQYLGAPAGVGPRAGDAHAKHRKVRPADRPERRYVT